MRQRATRQADRVREAVVARQADGAAADVDRTGSALRKVEDRAARRPVLVLGNADAHRREVVLEDSAGHHRPRAITTHSGSAPTGVRSMKAGFSKAPVEL